jgi:hypothetical protein
VVDGRARRDGRRADLARRLRYRVRHGGHPALLPHRMLRRRRRQRGCHERRGHRRRHHGGGVVALRQRPDPRPIAEPARLRRDQRRAEAAVRGLRRGVPALLPDLRPPGGPEVPRVVWQPARQHRSPRRCREGRRGAGCVRRSGRAAAGGCVGGGAACPRHRLHSLPRRVRGRPELVLAHDEPGPGPHTLGQLRHPQADIWRSA